VTNFQPISFPVVGNIHYANCEKCGCGRSTRGALVTIKGRAEPQQVEIVTGQTVSFAVVDAPGITIMDQRLKVG
jgi:hypothetical protein